MKQVQILPSLKPKNFHDTPIKIYESLKCQLLTNVATVNAIFLLINLTTCKYDHSNSFIIIKVNISKLSGVVALKAANISDIAFLRIK